MRCLPGFHEWTPWAHHWFGFWKFRDRHCLTCGKDQVREWDG